MPISATTVISTFIFDSRHPIPHFLIFQSGIKIGLIHKINETKTYHYLDNHGSFNETSVEWTLKIGTLGSLISIMNK